MKPTEIEALLPDVMRQTLGGAPSPLGALLDVMAQLHAPVEATLQRLDQVFRPGATDDAFVPLLARWVDLEHLFRPQDGLAARGGGAGAVGGEALSSGLGRLRELVARAAWLSQWRGTRHGLLAFLETACGRGGFEVHEQVPGADGLPRPFHMRIVAPDALRPHRPLIERIIESEKPAYVTCELLFKPTEPAPP